MNLQRVKELLAAWEAGVAREGELAELRRLLPAVIEAAGNMQPIDEDAIAGLAVESLPPDETVEYEGGFADGFRAGWRACEARWERRARTP